MFKHTAVVVKTATSPILTVQKHCIKLYGLVYFMRIVHVYRVLEICMYVLLKRITFFFYSKKTTFSYSYIPCSL